MKQSVRNITIIFFLILFVFSAAGCGLSGDAQPADEDLIKVEIQLDLQEDIGLLLTSWNVNGQEGMSGSSNADRSMIKHDSTEYWEFAREHLDSPSDTAELSLQFIVVTEYFEPDYDFDYPEESMIRMDPISLKAHFGETYYVKITGSKDQGYQAVLQTL